jgi:hypothetical protein
MLMHTASGVSVIATHAMLLGGEGTRAPVTSRSGERLSGQGVIGAVSSACPTATFIVMGHRVDATAETVYENGSCQSLHDGAQVALDVVKQHDGMIYAEKIAFLVVTGRQE